jgi:Flavin containing amine oxidoreductase/Carboxypeptidase regulatory-like domain
MSNIPMHGADGPQVSGIRRSTRLNVLPLASFAFLLTSFHPGVLRAQATGVITGTITDPTGAVIPGVKVTATRVETGVSQSTVTSGAGTYTVPHLVVGTYIVTAHAHGFKTGTASGITLDVAQQRELDFKLALAGVTSTVQVSAAPALLNTTTGTLGGIVSEEQVENLPLNGRDITGLIFLGPGMAQDSGSMGYMSSTPSSVTQFISNGNRGETETGTLDGSVISDTEMGTLQFTNFNLDAIAEFKVTQNDYSAQYGEGGGTITQIVSKSGTNQFHGSLFEFVRNSAFDARNFFATTVPPFRRNEFGAAIKFIGEDGSALQVVWQAAILKLRGVPLDPCELYRIKGGNQVLTDTFATKVGERLHLGAPVTRIERGENAIRVHYRESGREKQIDADYLVCCMSAIMLRLITVTAPWPEENAYAINQIAYDIKSRVVFQSRTAFWKRDHISPNWDGASSGLRELWSMAEEVPTSRAILVATAENSGTPLDSLSAFRRLYPGKSEDIEQAVIHTWAEDHWSAACQTLTYPPGILKRMWPSIMAPVGRVHFAGAYTDNMNWGMEAATRSAYRVAEAISHAQ